MSVGGGRLAGKRAAVIGAGAIGPGWGNGKAAAALFAREGARVLCVDRDADAAAEIVALIRAEGGGAAPFVADMTEPEAARAAAAAADGLWGGLDIVHFNIGISARGGVAAASLASWRGVFAVNLEAALHVVQATLPGMERQGGGAYVFVASLAAWRATGYAYASYESSKAALCRFARTLAVEGAAKGVRANVILPGLIDTPHVARHIVADPDALAAEGARRAAVPPMRRQGTAWEVAEAALFLASDAASYVTGAELPVDGGLSCLMPAP